MSLDLSQMSLKERTRYLELKEKYKNKLKPWYKKWWGVLIIIILFLVISLGTMAALYVRDKIQEIKTENEYNAKVESDKAMQYAIYGDSSNFFMGVANAPITIIEFSDFACPYCDKSHSILENIVKRYPGKVKIVFRDMPLHENSIDLALGARCAGEQGFFWPAHNLIFENQNNLNLSTEELKTTLASLFGTLGIDQTLFNTCFNDRKYISAIARDYKAATDLNLQGTPTWFINGQILTGYLSQNDYFTLLDNYFSAK